MWVLILVEFSFCFFNSLIARGGINVLDARYVVDLKVS